MAHGILDSYLRSAPSLQNALDIFRGEWSSRLPGPFADLQAGQAGLFDDPRVHWAMQQAGGVSGKQVLELGPLEGGHTFMLSRAGASVVAIEANTHAFLKCLITREILRLERVQYRCGDFTAYLRDTTDRYDLVFACGVLYHMTDPMRLLADISRCAPRVFLWTHYYDAALVGGPRADIAPKFGATISCELEGLRYQRVEYYYQAALEWSGFCGGPEPQASWLSRDDILAGLKHFGFEHIVVNFDDVNHPNGPSIAVVASRGEERP